MRASTMRQPLVQMHDVQTSDGSYSGRQSGPGAKTADRNDCRVQHAWCPRRTRIVEKGDHSLTLIRKGPKVTLTLMLTARLLATQLSSTVVPGAKRIAAAVKAMLRTLLALVVLMTVTACGGEGGDADSNGASLGGQPGSGSMTKIQATSFSDLVARIRQNYPGRVPEDVLQEVLGYTAGEELFSPENGYFWWTRSAKRFNARYLRVNGGQQVHQDYTNTAPLVGYWKVDPPGDVPLATAVTNRLMQMRTYGTANGYNAVNHETNIAWGYRPGTNATNRTVDLVALTEGPVYDSNGVLLGRAVVIVQGRTSLLETPIVNGVYMQPTQISPHYFFARYRSYVLENRTGTGLLGLDVDMDVIVQPCPAADSLECTGYY